jgi:hypothetical protein
MTSCFLRKQCKIKKAKFLHGGSFFVRRREVFVLVGVTLSRSLTFHFKVCPSEFRRRESQGAQKVLIPAPSGAALREDS